MAQVQRAVRAARRAEGRRDGVEPPKPVTTTPDRRITPQMLGNRGASVSPHGLGWCRRQGSARGRAERQPGRLRSPSFRTASARFRRCPARSETPFPKVGEALACDREALPCDREAPACDREAPACDREAPACDRKAPACDRKAPACGREALACDRVALACDRVALACDREAPSCDREAPSGVASAPPRCQEMALFDGFDGFLAPPRLPGGGGTALRRPCQRTGASGQTCRFPS